MSFAAQLCVVALVIDADGRKHPVSLREGSTENATLVGDLLVDLREPGLEVTRPILAVLDGAKALVKGVQQVFDQPLIQRCIVHYAEQRIMWMSDQLAALEEDFEQRKSA